MTMARAEQTPMAISWLIMSPYWPCTVWDSKTTSEGPDWPVARQSRFRVSRVSGIRRRSSFITSTGAAAGAT